MTIAARCPICGSERVRRLYEASSAERNAAPSAFGSSRAYAASIAVETCLGCGAGWQAPLSDPDAVAAAYRGLQDDTYLAEEAARRRTLGRSLARVHERTAGARGRLLDVGCSAGLFLELARDAGWDVHGIEPSEWLAERARARLGGELISCSSFEQTPLSDATFDVVCLWDVLEHVTDPDQVLAKASRILRPGGILALNVPNLQSRIARLLGPRWPLLLPEHLFFFSPASLRLLFARHGFTVPSLHLHRVSFGVGYVAHRLAQHRFPGAALAGQVLGSRVFKTVRVPLLMGELTALGQRLDDRVQ